MMTKAEKEADVGKAGKMVTERVADFIVETGYRRIPQEDINKLLGILSFTGRDLVIQTPRYLELLVSYIRKKGIEKAAKLHKADLFDFFIYKKLGIEDKRLNNQKSDLIKSVLEKLALIM